MLQKEAVTIGVEATAHLTGKVRSETVYTEGGIADHADRIMRELVAIGVQDPDVSVDFQAGIVEVRFVAHEETNDVFRAAQKALGILRTAIHAAGGATPGWELNIKDLARGLVDA